MTRSISAKASVLAILAGTVTLGSMLGQGAASAAPGALSVLTIAGDNGGPFPNNKNPFSPNNGLGAVLTPMVYEGLLQFDLLTPERVIPWLASSYAWSDGGKTLTLKIRSGVTWSDATAFSSEDVVFTFDLLQKFPALNLSGLHVSSVTSPDAGTVVMTFDAPSYTQLFYIGTQPIVPKHIWQAIPDPVHAENANPVGTGPYLVSSYAPQTIVMRKNPHYWQSGKPAIDQLVYPDYTSNTTADLALEKGDAQWGGVFIAGIQRYTRMSAGNKYFFPAVTDEVIYPNLQRAPVNNLALRKAISLALDRHAIAQASDLGEEPPIETQTGLVLPYQKDFMAPQYANLTFKTDIAEAKRLLKGAGFKLDSSGALQAPDGRPIDLGLIVSAPYSDNVAGAVLIAQELKSAIGLKIHVVPEAVTQWQSDLSTGHFDLGLRFSETGPGPFYMFNAWLNSALTAEEGKPAGGNYERFRDAKADQLLAGFESSPSLAGQKEAMAGLEGILIDQLPVIPIMYQTDWGEYNTDKFTGWPSASNPYAIASTYDRPMNELVVLGIRPVPAK